MLMLTKPIRTQLLANGLASQRGQIDPVPVVKFFYPAGAGTWLFTELDADGDTLFGLCDPGQGTPELGSASLSELLAFRGRFGLGIERDRHFTGTHPLSVYASEAATLGRIRA